MIKNYLIIKGVKTTKLIYSIILQYNNFHYLLNLINIYMTN